MIRDPACRAGAGLLVVAAILKLGLLWRYGALPSDDTGAYLLIAEHLRHDPAILRAIPDWTSAALPVFAFRPYGYPALIALAQAMAGPGWGVLLVLCQMALSLVAGGLVFDLARRASGSVALALAAGIFYFLGPSLLWDQSILSDSVFASLFAITVLTLGRALLAGRAPGTAVLVLLGIFWGAAILLREVGLYLTIVPAWLCLWAASGTPRLARLAAFLLPVLLIAGAYAGWNQYRSGTAFLSVTGGANYLRPSFDIARAGLADPFDDGSKAAAILRAHPEEYQFPAQLRLLQRVHDGLGLASPIALQRVAFREYRALVLRHPLAYAVFVLRNLDPSRFAAVLLDPVGSYNDYFQLAIPPYRRVVPGTGWKSVRGLAAVGDWGGILLALLSLAATIFATLAWCATLVLVPLGALRQKSVGRLMPETRLALALLGSAVAVILFYALVHTESRLVMPAVAPALVAAARLAGSLLRRRGSWSIIQA